MPHFRQIAEIIKEMVGSLIKLGPELGIVVDAGVNPNGRGLVYKIKWLDPIGRGLSFEWLDFNSWNLRKLHDFKVLVKVDIYGEEQAGL